MSPTLSKMASSSSLAAIIQPTWSSSAFRPTPTLQDRAMDEDKILKQQGSLSPDSTESSLSSASSSATLSVSHPPLFGSTSHKLGMNMDMVAVALDLDVVGVVTCHGTMVSEAEGANRQNRVQRIPTLMVWFRLSMKRYEKWKARTLSSAP